MLELDGSSGGGQLVRTALALSALSGTPFRMEGIRGGRPQPGLRPQHLAAIELVTDVAAAEVSGASIDSDELEFDPGELRPGRYDADIGTAGSVTLLFDAVVPLAVALDGRLEVQVTGGTDVRWSPTFDYYRRIKLPLLRRLGVDVAVDLDGRGFYPAGGGRATLWLGPSTPDSLSLYSRGPLLGARVYSVASTDLADRDVAERQADSAVDGIDDLGLDVVERTVQYADARSTGTAVAIRLDSEEAIAGFDAIGERGKPAETVAGDAVERARSFADSAA
ncbi:MAG TPA: RNA 3'-terminal phosphate cyclase, partial [Halobacteriales archaeon]|nr:RNA 3'-terminal phosphate cyclase [Halobacteriales archaeon]